MSAARAKSLELLRKPVLLLATATLPFSGSGQALSGVESKVDIQVLQRQAQDLQRANRFSDAFEIYEKAREMADRIHEIRLQAVISIAMCDLASQLGEYEDAKLLIASTIEFIRLKDQDDLLALALARQGRYLIALHDFRTAVKVFEDAIVLAQRYQDSIALSEALVGVSETYLSLNRYDDAIKANSLAIVSCNRFGNASACRADALMARARILFGHGSDSEATVIAMVAVGSAARAHEALKTAQGDALLADCLAAQGFLDDAIAAALAAVNYFQSGRALVAHASADTRASLAWSRSGAYIVLADSLFRLGRLREGEYVLDLMKRSQVDGLSAKEQANRLQESEMLPVEPEDMVFMDHLYELCGILADNSERDFKVLSLTVEPSVTSPEAQRLNRAVDDSFARMAALDHDRGHSVSSVSRRLPMRDDISSLSSAEPGTLTLYTVITTRHVGVAVIGRGIYDYVFLKDGERPIGGLELMQKAEQVVVEQRRSSSDPWEASEKFNRILIGSLQKQIDKAALQAPDGIPTLIWTLDGVLRFVPLNALFDGKRYLLEKAKIVLAETEDTTVMTRHASVKPFTMLAVGISELAGFEGLTDLNHAEEELKQIARDPKVKDSRGPIVGQILLNDEFTLESLESGLTRSFSIIHFATHYIFEPGESETSHLVLSNAGVRGKRSDLSLDQLTWDPKLNFSNVRLVTISACGSGEPDMTWSARDLDSLALTLRRRGAAAILSSLWNIDDASTAVFMKSFYIGWSRQPDKGKLYAIRQAQLGLLNASSKNNESRSHPAATDRPDQRTGRYSHPYYWASYTLTGNYLD